MKVICTNDDWYSKAGYTAPLSAPIKGHIYTVVKVRKCKCGCKQDVYELEECEPGIYGYDVDNFKPVEYEDCREELASQVTVGDMCDSPIKVLN